VIYGKEDEHMGGPRQATSGLIPQERKRNVAEKLAWRSRERSKKKGKHVRTAALSRCEMLLIKGWGNQLLKGA